MEKRKRLQLEISPEDVTQFWILMHKYSRKVNWKAFIEKVDPVDSPPTPELIIKLRRRLSALSQH
jgi:hypothetical protein